MSATVNCPVWWVAHHDATSGNTTYDFGNGAMLIVCAAIHKAVKTSNGELIESIDTSELTAEDLHNILTGIAKATQIK